MIISTGFGSNLAIAADKSIPQPGDDQTEVPSMIVPVDKLLSPHYPLNGDTGETANNSFVTSYQEIRAASTAATSHIIVVLARGLWTISYNLIANFQLSAPVGASPRVQLSIEYPLVGKAFASIYGENDDDNLVSGTFRILCGQNLEIRLFVYATIAADAISAHASINGEKNI